MPVLDPTNPATLTSAVLAADEATIDLLLSGPGVTLAQAQTSKAGFVNAVFNAWRESPIAYTVGAGAYTWDATDESGAAMNAALLGAVATGANAALAGLVAAINAMLGTYGVVAATLNYYINQASLGTFIGDVPPLSAPPSVLSGSTYWTPIGAAAPVTVTVAELSGLLAAIASRRATLQALRASLLSSIAGCSTVAAVLAISVASAGW